MSQCNVEGNQYRVVESLGFQQGAGYVKIVSVRGVEKTVVSNNVRGPWRFWGVQDRLQPARKVEGQ